MENLPFLNNLEVISATIFSSSARLLNAIIASKHTITIILRQGDRIKTSRKL